MSFAPPICSTDIVGRYCPISLHRRRLRSRFRIKALCCFVIVAAVAGLIAMTTLQSPAADPSLESTLAPNENLVLEGVPPIPMAIAQTIERYTEFRSAGLASWHPTQREMLISTRFGNTTQAHQVKFPLGSRRQLTFFPERIAGATYQPTQGDYFVFSKDLGGNEFRQNYRYDLDTGDITLLTDGASKNSRGIWSHSGNSDGLHLYPSQWQRCGSLCD